MNLIVVFSHLPVAVGIPHISIITSQSNRADAKLPLVAQNHHYWEVSSYRGNHTHGKQSPVSPEDPSRLIYSCIEWRLPAISMQHYATLLVTNCLRMCPKL